MTLELSFLCCRPSMHVDLTLPQASMQACVAGKDHSIRLWAVPEQQAVQSVEAEPLSCTAAYKGHTDAVEAIAVSPGGNTFCSGGWDAHVHIWRTGTPHMTLCQTPHYVASSARHVIRDCPTTSICTCM